MGRALHRSRTCFLAHLTHLRGGGDSYTAPMRDSTYEANKLQKKLRAQTARAVTDYNMIGDGDRVMVCLSGGKDSYAMLDMLMSLARNAPIHFELVAVNLDQKQPGFPEHVLPEYLDKLGIEYHVIEEDTYSVVQRLTPEGKTTCPVCSRMRRGILYSFAQKIGATRVALGHHADDVVETLFLNLFHGGRLKAMPPKLVSDDQRNVLIRPLFYCREAQLERWAEIRDYPIIPCNLCGSQDNLQRQAIKAMLRRWDQEQPGRVANIARAISNVSPSHLSDPALYDFAGISANAALIDAINVGNL